MVWNDYPNEGTERKHLMPNKEVLDSWKEIAAYLNRSVKTSQRLEKELGLPIHRLEESPRARVFAYADEIDRWIEKMKHSEEKTFRDSADVKRILIPVLIVAFVATVTVGIGLILFKKRDPGLDPKRIVVSIFENHTGNPTYDTIGHMAADWITKGLARTGFIDVVPSMLIAPIYSANQGENHTHFLAKETGAGMVISGSYYLQNDNIQLNVQVIDAREGKLIRALEPVNGFIEDSPELIESLQQRLIGILAVIFDPQLKNYVGIAEMPPSHEAYEEYIEGQRLFYSAQFAQSIDCFLRAASFDTNFVCPLIMAAIAHYNLDEFAAADALAREVDRSAGKLAPFDRYHLDFLKAILKRDNHAALEARIQMAQIAPSIPITECAVAQSKIRINRPQEAVTIIASVDPESFWFKNWDLYWAELTMAYHMLGNHNQELKSARQSRKQFPELLSALWYEVRALAALGKIIEVNDCIDNCLTLPAQTDWNHGQVMLLAGRELREHGYREASLNILEHAIGWFKSKLRKELDSKTHRHGLGRALYASEKWTDAQSIYERLHTEFPENIDYLGYLGVIAARRGEIEEAQNIATKLKNKDRKYLFGNHTYWRACIAALLEEKDLSVRLLRESIAQGRSYSQFYPDMNLEPLRDFPPFKELIKPKG